MNAYMSMLESAEIGSIILLHACAHNPTGCDPTKEQWTQIGLTMKQRQLFPLFDAAYLGFRSGSIDEDAFAIRLFVDDLDMEAAICMSFAKNMGLYGNPHHELSTGYADQDRGAGRMHVLCDQVRRNRFEL